MEVDYRVDEKEEGNGMPSNTTTVTFAERNGKKGREKRESRW